MAAFKILTLILNKKITLSFFYFICFIYSTLLLAENTISQNFNNIERSEIYSFEIVTLSKNLKVPWGIASLPQYR